MQNHILSHPSSPKIFCLIISRPLLPGEQGKLILQILVYCNNYQHIKPFSPGRGVVVGRISRVGVRRISEGWGKTANQAVVCTKKTL